MFKYGNRKMTARLSQRKAFKHKHPDCVLLFRVDDFYEVFDGDAKTLHEIAGTALVRRVVRVKGVDRESSIMSGAPTNLMADHIALLIKAGFQVAVCDKYV